MYPLGVNTISRVGKFPVIFDINTVIDYTGSSFTEGIIRTIYLKIENDIPYKKLPVDKTVKLNENYERRPITAQEAKNINMTAGVEIVAPLVDIAEIPNRIGKYWVRCSYGSIQHIKYYHPDYSLTPANNYKVLRLSYTSITEFALFYGVSDTMVNHRFEIFNKLPPLELPIVIQFNKIERRVEYYTAFAFGSNYFKALTHYHELKHTYKQGTHPFFLNLGNKREQRDYVSGSFEDGIFHTVKVSKNVAHQHNTNLRNQGILYGEWNIPSWKNMSNADVQAKLKERFIYEFIYPREYGLKGIKFHDVLHEYKIDSFTKPTGNGEVIYDRFYVKLAYPMNSTIEITKEPTSWAFDKARIGLRTRAGWLNSGSDKWGNSPVAEGGDILTAIPAGMELVGAARALSANTGTDKWLGYGFLFRWPFGNKVGIRLVRKPTNTLLRENVADPNFSIELTFNPNHATEKYPTVGITLKDYNPASVRRASTYRDAKNRWSIYLNPVDFEIELYRK